MKIWCEGRGCYEETTDNLVSHQKRISLASDGVIFACTISHIRAHHLAFMMRYFQLYLGSSVIGYLATVTLLIVKMHLKIYDYLSPLILDVADSLRIFLFALPKIEFLSALVHFSGLLIMLFNVLYVHCKHCTLLRSG